MLLSHYFAALTDRLGKIRSRIAVAEDKEKAELYNVVLQLRQISDLVVEEWLGFEEQLVEVQRMFEQEEDSEDAAFSLSEIEQTEEVQEIYLPYALANKFRQGQGYFMLSMYQEAVESFSRVIEEAPDIAVARLYLAFGFLMSRRLDVAYPQFRLLVETCEHPFIYAASCNALGCITVFEGDLEQGLVWFERSLESCPDLTDARYNQALTLYRLGHYKEALKAAMKLLEEQNKDIEVFLLLSACCIKNGNKKEAYSMLKQAEKYVSGSKQRKAIAQAYERMGSFADAARCYQMLLPDYRGDASVWHGLGWSLWQVEQTDKAVSYLKYALTLAPQHPDYPCSYAWVLLCLGDTEKAWRVFDDTARKHNQPLAWAGMVEVLLKQHRITEAQTLIDELIGRENGRVRALGHYLQGRTFLLQGKYEEALQHFSTSHAAGVIRESALYAGILHYADGAHDEAYERWKEVVPEL
jgi:tetratricopeptide (TPR) repeat protein